MFHMGIYACMYSYSTHRLRNIFPYVRITSRLHICIDLYSGNGKGVGMRSGRPSDMERGREGAQVIGSMDAGDSDDDSDSDSDGGAGRNFSDDDDLGSSDESGLDDDLDDDLDMDEDDDEEEFF